tara:strand:+ start:865 stop:1143 length:279 start_codon:yes stop_codon:yes gene_type:complete
LGESLQKSREQRLPEGSLFLSVILQMLRKILSESLSIFSVKNHARDWRLERGESLLILCAVKRAGLIIGAHTLQTIKSLSLSRRGERKESGH